MRNTVNDTQVGFVQGTTVLMANGSLKPIEKVVPGDWVMSFDQTDAASELEPMEVIDSINYISRDIIEVKADDRAVMVARGQLFLTPSADWHYATDTAFITDAEGNAKSFTVDKVQDGKHRVYDIMVDQHHSLVANGFRVHNVAGGAGGLGTRPNPSSGSQTQQSAGVAKTSGGQGTSKSPPSNKPTKDNTKPDTKKTSDPGNKQSVNNKDNGGRGKGGDGPGSPGRDNGQNQVNRKSAKKTKSDKNDRPKSDPPPAPEAMSYAALQSLQETMNYICDVMIGYYNKNYFTVRAAVTDYMNYADALAVDSVIRAMSSNKISAADKNNLQLFNLDIMNIHTLIRAAWADPNNVAVDVSTVTNACLNVKMFVDRSKGVLGKYVGTGRSTIDYTLPNMPKPDPVKLPATPSTSQYVQTAPGIYLPNTPTVPAVTGGLGAPYYRYRTVRGYLYGYSKVSGWVKIGPADQWEGQY